MRKVSGKDTSPNDIKEEVVYKDSIKYIDSDNKFIEEEMFRIKNANGNFDGIRDIYFFDLQHTRELYADFDLKLRVLYVLMKEPYMSIKQIIRRLGGKYDSSRSKIKNILVFWHSIGVVSIPYDKTCKTFPSPIMWECDREKAKDVISAFSFVHKVLVNRALDNGGCEKVIGGNKASTYCIKM